jgi:hypothetical protein
MRGAPHRGLARLIRRIRSMTSFETEGQPFGWRLFQLNKVGILVDARRSLFPA